MKLEQLSAKRFPIYWFGVVINVDDQTGLIRCERISVDHQAPQNQLVYTGTW